VTRVYRIQDSEGRGPWRPGFSCLWADSGFGPGVENLPPWTKEFGPDLLARRGLPGEYYGCAVRRLSDLSRWVSATERQKLAALGFEVVSLRPDRVLAESRNQLVFATRVPLKRAAATVVPWVSVP
jgi:hypothetical protein